MKCSKLTRLKTAIAVATLASAAAISNADASVILTYTGNNFTSVSGSYTTSDHITGVIELASPLGKNLSLADVTPTSFSFSDAHQTFTEATSLSLVNFEFSTDGSGIITGWAITLQMGSKEDAIDTGNFPVLVADLAGLNSDNAGGVGNNPGTWSVRTDSTPEPLTVSIFGAGLAGAIAMRRRRAKS